MKGSLPCDDLHAGSGETEARGLRYLAQGHTAGKWSDESRQLDPHALCPQLALRKVGQRGAVGTWRLLGEGLGWEAGRRQRSETEAEGGPSSGEPARREQGKGAGGGERGAGSVVSSSP